MRSTVIAVVDDLFFASKIRAAGQQAGVDIVFVKSIAAAVEKARDERPALIVADLNARCCDGIELAKALKGDERCSAVPLIGFFSHVQTQLQEAAMSAGFDKVIPRSAFSKNLAGILAR
jgi:CheY-like chemotaxis protein